MMAAIKPMKKFRLNFSPAKNKWAKIAVKKGAIEIITPTLDA
jgi:hypothetical protein